MTEQELPEIPGYAIKEKLGEGGMASIYLAAQEKLEREVAIKVLNPLLIRDPQTLKRFQNEAHTAAKLVHPNIITIFDVGQVGNTHYIVMEYLKESLRSRLKTRGKLPPAEALEIIKKIAAALHEAHNNGIIHRDIKPDNVMFRPDGTPVLLDFGIARALDINTRLTMTGISIGTPHYMSPEQCRGEEIDGRSDLYALGVLLFELLTGKVPYTSEYSTGLIYLHTQGPVPQLPVEFEKFQPLIDVMMAKNREARIKSGAELVKRIQWLENDLTPVEPEPGKKSGLRWLSRFKRKKVLTLILLVIAVLGLLAYFFILPVLNVKANQKPPLIVIPKSSIKPEWFPKPIMPMEYLLIVGTGPQTGEKGTPVAEEQFKRNLALAEQRMQAGDYDIALQYLAKAKEIKNSSEIDHLERKIKEKITGQKTAEYNNYFNLAREAYTEGNFDKALEYTAEARRLKSTEELDRLEREIKTRQEETKIKTVNFVNLPREKIAEMNDHIKRIEIPGLEPGVIVGGEISLHFLVDENGGIDIKQWDDSRLFINPADKKEVVKTMILEKFRRISFKPLEDESGKPQRIENWRKDYQLATFRGTIILY